MDIRSILWWFYDFRQTKAIITMQFVRKLNITVNFYIVIIINMWTKEGRSEEVSLSVWELIINWLLVAFIFAKWSNRPFHGQWTMNIEYRRHQILDIEKKIAFLPFLRVNFIANFAVFYSHSFCHSVWDPTRRKIP